MNLPRLIIADEHKPGKIPAGALIAAALKEMGYKLKLFVGSADETLLQSLQLLCGQPVTLLDPVICERRANLRWLFQNIASEDCLNLIITNLGGRWTEDSAFRLPKETLLLAEWLECELLPIIYSDTSYTITMRTVTEIVRHFERDNISNIHAILFRSVLNNREYELLDREIGRYASVFSMGTVPSSMDRDVPPIAELCSDNAARAIFPLRSSARQLKGMDYTINWALLAALAGAASEWQTQSSLCDPITDSGKVNIAVVRHNALSIGGDGTEQLMKILGCNLVDVPLDGNISHNVPIHGIYIPHGLIINLLPKFFSNLYVKTMIKRGSTGSSFLFAEGGSAPLLGKMISLPIIMGGGEAKGFGVLPFSSNLKGPSFGAPLKRFARAVNKNPLMREKGETIWGYGSTHLSLTPDLPGDNCWETGEDIDDPATGFEGMASGRMLAASMRLEFWSNPRLLRRWLEG